MKMPPRLYLGTMTFGWSQTSSRVDEAVAVEMVQRFVRHNNEQSASGSVVHRLDTARIYAGGKTETILGAVLPQCSDAKLAVGTKAHPSQSGGLSPAGIEGQLQASLQAMGHLKTIDEFYLHQPDPEHALAESLQCVHGHVQQGTFRVVGMSNYHASEMQRAFDLCRQHGWTPPTVYQGLYNPLNRLVEQDLLPVLRENQCSFVAYNPLAAGLLAGKHTSLDDVQKGRFKNNPNYLPRFYTESNFAALELIRTACDAEGIGLVEATYRWLLCHSALTETDGVLLGASSMAQLDQNLQACAVAASEKGALPASILEAFEKGWELVQQGGDVFPYWRSYSADMPNREALDPGASYQASKKK